eukprot:TRINITY_DN13536_c0_g2_i1.p1 TRINITY_DN13536_c0_g2~~TRINITY_DN13536_c0_g2_i1.p1  ORF type:complete len:376 (+),score=110.21 TRINITY_DN13536_c0_g2_i1:134-1261(+)
MAEWCTIESDPGVFTELIKEIGVKNVAVEEIYSLEDDYLLNSLKPIYGLVFLFKWTSDIEKRETLAIYDQELFFANQVITNACATQAILSILLNAPQIDIGEELRNFKAFAQEMDPQMKGLAISNCELVRKVHNSFARPEPFVYGGKKKKATEDDDLYHFISYVPFKGKLYELDGLQRGPILLGEFTNDEEWIEHAKQEINRRIEKYAAKEIRFTLLAVNASRKQLLESELVSFHTERLRMFLALEKRGFDLDEDIFRMRNESRDFLTKHKVDINEIAPPGALLERSQDDLRKMIAETNGEIERLNFGLSEEEAKYRRFEVENTRRRHNYIPFILELLKISAEKGILGPLVEEERKKKKEKLEQAAAAKANAGKK